MRHFLGKKGQEGFRTVPRIYLLLLHQVLRVFLGHFLPWLEIHRGSILRILLLSLELWSQ